MNKRFLFPSLLSVILVISLYSGSLSDAQAAPFATGKTLVLYDAASGAIPSSSLMGFSDFPPGGATLTYSEGATVLDTTIAGRDTFAGWVASGATTSGFPILERTTGVQINFTMQVESETHANNNRAGFSVIVLDSDAKGIELSFWENEVWAQSDDNSGGLFRRGERTAFATTGLTDYQLALAGDTYTLTANAQPLLTGPVRDYSAFSGFPDPYETPNFLFFGDDTTSSQARIRLHFLSVSGSEPVIPTIAVTSTNTSLPLATPSFTPLPSATAIPLPTPTPARPVMELCPSGWLFGAVMIVTIGMVKKLKRRVDHF